MYNVYCTVLSIWGEMIILLCVRNYMGVWGSWWLKRLPRHRNDLSVWRWRLLGPDMRLFGLQIANTKDLPVQWPVLTKFRDFLNQVLHPERICTGPFYSSANVSVVLGWKGLNGFPPSRFQQQKEIQNREVQFLPILVFWALLLKIQTPITLLILGVRGSFLGSRELLTIPFNDDENTKILTSNRQ